MINNLIHDLQFDTCLTVWYMTYSLIHDLQFDTWLTIWYMTYNLLHDWQFVAWLTIWYMTYNLMHDLQFDAWLTVWRRGRSIRWSHRLPAPHNAPHWPPGCAWPWSTSAPGGSSPGHVIEGRRPCLSTIRTARVIMWLIALNNDLVSLHATKSHLYFQNKSIKQWFPKVEWFLT